MTFPGISTLQVACIAVVAVLAVGGVQQLRVAAAKSDAKAQAARADRQQSRADTLALEVSEARASAAAAKDINDRAAGTIAELQRAYDTLAAAAAQREAATAARLEAAERAVAVRRAADIARRARPDAPPVSEMTAVMAEAVGGIR